VTDHDTHTGSSDSDDELRALLRGADPAALLPPAGPERVARLLEEAMSSDLTNESRETGTHGRSPLTWMVAAATVIVIAGVGFLGVRSLGDDPDPVPSAQDPTTATQPTVTELTAPGPVAGRCMVPNPELLATQSVAFEGTVQEISDGVVTLVPSHFYTGSVTDLVEVTAPADQMAELIGAVDFQDGGTYLVSATGGEVTVCGFSGPVTPELEALYVQAFPR
jgi:hypothetical protein